jgi:hypothetical protein
MPWSERTAGDNRHIVEACEARNNAFRDRVESCLHKARDVRQNPLVKRALDIGRIAAVIANDHYWPVGPAIWLRLLADRQRGLLKLRHH